MGTGGHYALEDYHGYNYYKHPVEAFRAYNQAYRLHIQKTPNLVLPEEIDEQLELGEAILEYYLLWLKNRDPLETLWVDGKPQCEIKGSIPLPQLANEHYDEVYYQFTLDRVVVIEGELWVLDYKFYNRDWVTAPEFDSQMSAYIWAASCLYDRPVAGAILEKHFKKIPKDPRILRNGDLSGAKDQDTTYHQYREVMIDMYGSVDKSPPNCRETLTVLAAKEGPESDGFIQRMRTTRTEIEIGSIGAQIMMEGADMLNKDLPLYKNDTKDCSWDCGFSDICLMMDQGHDWEGALELLTVDRNQGDDGWRDNLPDLESLRSA